MLNIGIIIFLALKSEFHVNHGQLGLGHNEKQNKPQLLMHREKIHQIACGGYHTVILKGNLVPEGQVGLEATLSLKGRLD